MPRVFSDEEVNYRRAIKEMEQAHIEHGRGSRDHDLACMNAVEVRKQLRESNNG